MTNKQEKKRLETYLKFQKGVIQNFYKSIIKADLSNLSRVKLKVELPAA